MNKNKNGFTLIEIIVSLLVASIGMLIATSLILNSMGYFSKTTVSDHDKQALDGINTYVADELRYASEVKIDIKKPDDTDWNWIYWKDGRLYKNKDQNTINDYMVYNDDFYNNRTLTFTARGFDSYRLDLKFAFEDANKEVVYSVSSTLELMNLKVKKTQDSKYNPFSNISTEIELSGAQNNYKIYYKKGTLPKTNNTPELSGDGTVADEIYCKDSKITNIGSSGNNKGEYVENATYKKGDFVFYQGSWYRALPDILSFQPGKTWEWKKIEKDYDVSSNFSNYAYGDIVIYEGEYWQVTNINGSIGQLPSKAADAVWNGGFSTIDILKKTSNYITPSYTKCKVEMNYTGLVANKDDKETNIPAYDTAGKYGQFIFRTYEGSVWYKLYNGYGNISPGELDKDGYVWQKIQRDWDATSAYLAKDSSFSNKADIIRFSENGLYYMATTDIRDGRKPAVLKNGVWITNTGWKEVTWQGNGVWK